MVGPVNPKKTIAALGVLSLAGLAGTSKPQEAIGSLSDAVMSSLNLTKAASAAQSNPLNISVNQTSIQLFGNSIHKVRYEVSKNGVPFEGGIECEVTGPVKFVHGGPRRVRVGDLKAGVNDKKATMYSINGNGVVEIQATSNTGNGTLSVGGTVIPITNYPALKDAINVIRQPYCQNGVLYLEVKLPNNTPPKDTLPLYVKISSPDCSVTFPGHKDLEYEPAVEKQAVSGKFATFVKNEKTPDVGRVNIQLFVEPDYNQYGLINYSYDDIPNPCIIEEWNNIPIQ